MSLASTRNNRGLPAQAVNPYEDGQATEIGGGAIVAFNEAGIDKQIATAHRFPRSVAKALSEATDLAIANKNIAAACTYALPRGGKNIIGPSVRLAEIFQYAWGNLRTASMIVGDDGRFIKVSSIGLDLQKNSGFQVEVMRRITDKNGKRYDDDMIAVTANAAASIARRNAIFLLIPRAFVDQVHSEAKKVAGGKLMTLEEDRHIWVKHFADQGVPDHLIYAALGVKGLADVTSDHLVILQGYNTSVNEGSATLEDIFAPPKPPPAAVEAKPGATKSAGLADRIKAEAQTAAEPPEPGSNG